MVRTSTILFATLGLVGLVGSLSVSFTPHVSPGAPGGTDSHTPEARPPQPAAPNTSPLDTLGTPASAPGISTPRAAPTALAFLPTDPHRQAPRHHPTPAEGDAADALLAEMLAYPHVPDRIVVQFADNATQEAILVIQQAHGLHIDVHFPNLGGGLLATLRVEDPAELIPTMRALLLSGLVESVEPDNLAFLADALGAPEVPPSAAWPTEGMLFAARAVVQAATPTDTYFGNQWHLQNTGGGYGGAIAGVDINALAAWDYEADATRVLVAIIDTGARMNHADLTASFASPAGYDFVNEDGVPDDAHGHGTHVAGIVGATGYNGIGVSGVAPQARLVICKVAGANGSFSLTDRLQAYQYCIDRGVSVINASYGGPYYAAAEFSAIQALRNAGIVFVAAAGNDGKNTDTSPNYPSCYALDNIVSVGASDYADNRAYFSNYGKTTVDLFAPGYRILSTTFDGGYGEMSGTSMAAPVVTGGLALIRAHRADLTYAQSITALLAGTVKPAGLAGTSRTGRLELAVSLRPIAIDRDPSSVTVAAKDRFFRDTAGGIYYLDTFNPTRSPVLLPDRALSPWQAMTYGDADGDGQDELVFHQTSTGQVAMWNLDNFAVASLDYLYAWAVNPQGDADTYLPTTSTLTPVGTADVNRDGSDDLIWIDASGQPQIWFMAGTILSSNTAVTQSGGLPASAAAPWKLVDVADLDPDDTSVELLWQNTLTGEIQYWQLDADAKVTATGTIGAATRNLGLLKARDINGDDRVDLVIYDYTARRMLGWSLSGLAYADVIVLKDNKGKGLTSDPKNYRLVDVTKLSPTQTYLTYLWQHVTTGQFSEWRINTSGVRIGSGVLGTPAVLAGKQAYAQAPKLGGTPAFFAVTKAKAAHLAPWANETNVVQTAEFVAAHPLEYAPASLPVTSRPVNFCDFNEDGTLELVVQDKAKGRVLFYPITAGELGEPVTITTTKGVVMTAGGEWELIDALDYRVTGTTGLELIWRSTKTNRTWIWFCDKNYQIIFNHYLINPKKTAAVMPAEWIAVDLQPTDIESQMQMLWYNTRTRAYCAWTINRDTSMVIAQTSNYFLPLPAQFFRRF